MWANTDVVGMVGLRDEFIDIPYRFDTDVNAPALAEFKLNRANNSSTSSAYITVGTGIGVGLVVNNQTVKGLLHPEAGHIEALLKLRFIVKILIAAFFKVKRCPGDAFVGSCPYHRDCIEGMCSTGALAARLNCSSSAELAQIADNDPIWPTCAYYIAQLCAHLILIASPGWSSHNLIIFPSSHP